MNEAKHIKGPWSFYASPQPNGCPIVGDPESGMMICQVAHSINETGQAEIALAHARLIAAAPELLEALSWYENKAKEMGRAAIHSDSKRILELMKEIAVDYGKVARAAIAKATVGAA